MGASGEIYHLSIIDIDPEDYFQGRRYIALIKFSVTSTPIIAEAFTNKRAAGDLGVAVKAIGGNAVSRDVCQLPCSVDSHPVAGFLLNIDMQSKKPLSPCNRFISYLSHLPLAVSSYKLSFFFSHPLSSTNSCSIIHLLRGTFLNNPTSPRISTWAGNNEINSSVLKGCMACQALKIIGIW